MKSLILLATTALISINAFAMSPDVTLDSIKPVAGSKDLLIHFTSDNGAKYEFRDDDGLATLISVNYMISWEREVLLGNKKWDDIKGQDAKYYDVARPLLIQQLRRLSEGYKAWAAQETDHENAAAYLQNAEKADLWVKNFSDQAKASNEDMSNFTEDLNGMAGIHSYKMSQNGGEFESGQRIYGNGDGEIGTHHSGINSKCKSATNGDLAAVVKNALNGGTLEEVLKDGEAVGGR